MEPQPVLAAACLLFTMGMFCSGLFDLCRIITTKSVDNIQFLRFLAIKANNLCWLGYGCRKPDRTLIIINSIGAALQSLYILVYFYYSTTKRQVLLKVLTFLALLAVACGYFCYFPDEDTLLSHMGFSCSSLTIMMYASPLTDLAKVIRSRSTRCLSFPLTVTAFLASSCWTLYGLWLEDKYITVPNVPGIFTSVVQLWLFWRYAPGRDNPYRPLHA